MKINVSLWKSLITIYQQVHSNLILHYFWYPNPIWQEWSKYYMSVDLTSFQLSFVVLKHISYPAKPNSFIALASQLRVSAWFFGFFCANAKDTTWKKIISQSSIWLLLYRTFQNSFDWLGERGGKKKKNLFCSPRQWTSLSNGRQSFFGIPSAFDISHFIHQTIQNHWGWRLGKLSSLSY